MPSRLSDSSILLSRGIQALISFYFVKVMIRKKCPFIPLTKRIASDTFRLIEGPSDERRPNQSDFPR